MTSRAVRNTTNGIKGKAKKWPVCCRLKGGGGDKGEEEGKDGKVVYNGGVKIKLAGGACRTFEWTEAYQRET